MKPPGASARAARWPGVLALAVAVALGACERTPPESLRDSRILAGDAGKGRLALLRYGCVSCHVVPGIRGAPSQVGPPLHSMARRSYIAGVLPNTPDNLALWIMDPLRVSPRTAMPDLGVSEQEAHDIAAYLYEQSD